MPQVAEVGCWTPMNGPVSNLSSLCGATPLSRRGRSNSFSSESLQARQSFAAGLKALQLGSYAEAARHLRDASDEGHPGAQCCLGALYEEGRGVELSDGKAVRWYRLSADQGHAQAQCNLALMYEHGRGGLEVSEVIAAPLFQVAAENGDTNAMYNLGIYLEEGRGGLFPDREAARCWHAKAAAQGHVDAQYSNACLLLKAAALEADAGIGAGSGLREAEAQRLLEHAAAKGHALSVSWPCCGTLSVDVAAPARCAFAAPT